MRLGLLVVLCGDECRRRRRGAGLRGEQRLHEREEIARDKVVVNERYKEVRVVQCLEVATRLTALLVGLVIQC